MDDFRPIRVLRLKQVQQLLGLSRSTIYDRLNPTSRRYDETFPRPIKLSARSGAYGPIGFIEDELLVWISARIHMRAPALEKTLKKPHFGTAAHEVKQ